MRTNRLVIRRFVQQDAKLLEPVFMDDYSQRFYPSINTPEAVEGWVAWNMKLFKEQGLGLCAVELASEGSFVGDAGLSYQTVEGERILEVGWHIHPAFRSRGYASEAGKAFREYAFETFGVACLGSVVDPTNEASIKVASRVHTECRSYQGKSGPMLLFYTVRSSGNIDA